MMIIQLLKLKTRRSRDDWDVSPKFFNATVVDPEVQL